MTRLSQAIDAFNQRPPPDMPEGFAEKLSAVSESMKAAGPAEQLSPGQQDVRKASHGGTDGTGESYKTAARGPDQPSPGQREARGGPRNMSSEIHKAAGELIERMKAEQNETAAAK
jgi:hypothetical protein